MRSSRSGFAIPGSASACGGDIGGGGETLSTYSFSAIALTDAKVSMYRHSSTTATYYGPQIEKRDIFLDDKDRSQFLERFLICSLIPEPTAGLRQR